MLGQLLLSSVIFCPLCQPVSFLGVGITVTKIQRSSFLFVSDTKGFCKSSVTDIMKACTEDSKLLVQTRCLLAGSLYLLENLSARQFFHCWHMPNCAQPWRAMMLCSFPKPTVNCFFFLTWHYYLQLFSWSCLRKYTIELQLEFFSRCVLNLCFYMNFHFFYSFNVSFLGNT